MRIASYTFSANLWSFFLYLLVLACMLRLGVWQLDRAALKVSMQAATNRAMLSQAIPIAEMPGDVGAAAQQYRRVLVEGVYDTERHFLWDNRTHKGVAGYEVITPVWAGEIWVLVNRGWVSLGSSRDVLPEVGLPEAYKNRTMRLEGLLSRPSKGFASGPAFNDVLWPRVMQYFDYAAISDALGAPVLHAVVQPQALSADGRTVEVFSPHVSWLEASWQPAASGPAKHYSYAFQWFAMALALTVLFITVNTKKARTAP